MCGKLVPFVALFYIIGADCSFSNLNAGQIPHAFALIFSSAFTGHAASRRFLGAALKDAMRMGVARGVFTNEAGLGSAPIAHAAATTDHPVRQGMWVF